MQPSDWWPHYALGWVYAGGGQYAQAIASFEKAMALRPGLYDVQRELQRLRPLAAQSAARSTPPSVVSGWSAPAGDGVPQVVE